MANCPNINLDSWKNLVAARGEDMAYYLWDKYAGNVPEEESKSEVVKAGLKSVNALQSDKAIQLFSTLQKNRVTGDVFWNKIQQDLQIPKEQIELLKQYNTTDREQLITNMLADYSFAIEIDTTTSGYKRGYNVSAIGENEGFELDGDMYDYFPLDNLYYKNQENITKEEYEKAKNKISGVPTQYYSNLTVPGGTNYTENEIATPAITPSIKGHAQFATHNGIGWFRSDDKVSEKKKEYSDKLKDAYYSEEMSMEGLEELEKQGETSTKTRRILEVQSDLFQKGRDKEDLVGTNKVTKATGRNGDFNDKVEFIEGDRNQNQFLQLLNKDNNWVTFFVKSIIQDSAKKGYEKVLFPSGNTASKVEGHATLEEFKKQKEDRIKVLEMKLDEIKSDSFFNNNYKIVDNLVHKKSSTKENPNIAFTTKVYSEKEAKEVVYEFMSRTTKNEINQLKQELERVEKEGFGALRPIYKFYSIDVRNTLIKQYGEWVNTEVLKTKYGKEWKEKDLTWQELQDHVKSDTLKFIIDEYGNTWNEIQIVPEREKQAILLQKEGTETSKASPETIARVKQVLEKMGVAIKSLSEYAKGAKLDIPGGVNGLADIASKIIAIAEGKEDVALTEEMVHIATAILEQKNPGLVTEMISKIDRFAIYKRTLEEYKNNPAYQLPNGKPDIRKIKKEAVDKLIVELIVNEGRNTTEFPELMEEENVSLVQKWWRKILDWFSSTYRKADIDIFQEAAKEIMGEKFSAEGADLSSYGMYYQISDAQKAIQKRIMETKNIIRKKEDVTSPVDPLFLDTEEASNYYEALQPDGTWKRVVKRVTDRVKNWYKNRFAGKVFTAQEKRFNEFKRKTGVKGHRFFEDIHGRFFNAETGERKPKTSERQIKLENNVDREIYNTLEKYFVELIDSFTKDGKTPLVFSEVMLYDPKEGEAGTIDLLIVDENGKANIIDWKFMSVGASVDNLPWFKQGAFNIQLRRYKDILREVYGVKEVGMNRAIPIIMKVELENYKKENSPIVLKGIAIGTVDTSKISDFTLLPFSEQSESTGIDELDEVLKKLNTVYNQIAKKEISSSEEYEFKMDRLQILNKAIRKLQTSKDLGYLLNVIQIMSKEGEILSRDYTMKYKGKSTNSKGPDFEQKALSDFAASLREYAAFAKVFGNITDYIGDFIYNEKMEKEVKTKEEKDQLTVLKKALNDIKKQQDNIRRSSIEVGKIAGEFADKFIGERNIVRGLLDAEAIVKGLSSLFRGVSDLGMASLEILVKMVSNAKDRGVRDASGNVDRLMEIRKKLVARGGDIRKLVQRIYQKDEKNNPVNKIIHRYKKDFFEQVDLNALEGARSKKWLTENIDIEEYKKEANELLEKKIARIKDLYSDDEEIDEKILEERRKYDISRKDFVGWNNYIIKRHPLPKWESEEYKEIKKDKDLFELYEFIVEMNNKAKEVGYISNQAASTFLPFVRKGMVESLTWDFDLSAITNFGNTLSLRADDVGYGNLNELTNELENSIPKYYTYDFTRGEDGVNDYSEVSEDIFKNMILYIGHVEKYKYLSEIEEQLLLVKKIEQFKGHLRTNNIGEAVLDERGIVDVLGEGEKDSEGNAKIFNDFLRALLYEQKYPLSDSDTPLNIGAKEFIKKTINKVAGREVFKPEENPSATSLVKTMDAANKAFQLKTLGFEFISGAVNAFGSNIQIAAQSGNYFKSREVLANEFKLIGNKWKNKEEYDMYTQLVNLILPLREDPNYEKMKAAGLNPFTKRSFSDDIMVFMRYPEQHLEKAVFLTLLENTMVVDGKFVNINEYVRKKYKGRSESAARYKEASAKIAKEVEELKKTRSINAIKKLENGKLVIPGFDLSNIEEVQKLSSLTKRISRNALGGMSEADMNRIGLNIWTKSMMVFKNWIPKLLDTRFGEFRKVSDDFSVEIGDDGLTTGEKYDIGRIRLFANFLHFNILKTASEIINVLSVNEKGLLKINELYEKYATDFKKRTGKDLEMSRDEFVDLIRTNLRNQTKELMMLAVLFSSTLALGMFKPDDDDDRADKNFYRFSQRVLDKFVGELSFFYNPVEFEKLLSGSAFPAVGLTTDFARFTNHFFMQITGTEFLEFDSDLTQEQVRKKAQPIKNLGKMFPGTKSLFTYGGILDADFAKEFDITIQKESSFR